MSTSKQQDQDWPPAVSARDFADGATKHGSTGQLFRASNGQWVRVRDDERKRKTVNVRCGITNGVLLRIYRKPIREGEPAMPDPEREPVKLQAGANSGIDAEFFTDWLEQNQSFAKSAGITAEDEDDESLESAKRKE